MNTSHTRRSLITSAAGAVVLAAESAAALPEAPSSAPAARHTPNVATSSAMPALVALVTPNRVYAATGRPPVVVLGPSGSLAFPDGYFVAPVGGLDATGGHGGTRVQNPSMSLAPTTYARSTSSAAGSGGGRSWSAPG